MRRFHVRNIVTAATAVTADHKLELQEQVAGPVVTKAATVAGSAVRTNEFWGLSASQGSVNKDWGDLNWGMSLQVDAAGPDLTYHPAIQRVSSSGASLRVMDEGGGTHLQMTNPLSGTGIKTATGLDARSMGSVVASSADWDSSRLATDRLGLLVVASNSNMMTAETLSIGVESSDTWIEGGGLTMQAVARFPRLITSANNSEYIILGGPGPAANYAVADQFTLESLTTITDGEIRLRKSTTTATPSVGVQVEIRSSLTGGALDLAGIAPGAITIAMGNVPFKLGSQLTLQPGTYFIVILTDETTYSYDLAERSQAYEANSWLRTGDTPTSATWSTSADRVWYSLGEKTPTGAGTLTASGTPGGPSGEWHTGSGALAGSGTLTVTGGVPRPAGAVGLAGAGVMAGAGTPRPVAAVNMAGSGGPTASGLVAFGAAVAVSGEGSFGTVGSLGALGPGALAGSGSLTASGVSTKVGSAAPSGSGTAVATALVTVATAQALTGSGTTGASGSLAIVTAGPTSGSGSLGVASSPRLVHVVEMAGAGGSQASGLAAVGVAVALAGQGSFTNAGSLGAFGPGSFTGSGVLAAIAGGVSVVRSLTLTGAGSTSVATIPHVTDPWLLLVGDSSTVAASTPRPASSVPISGVGQLAATGLAVEYASTSVDLSGTGTQVVVGRPVVSAAVAATGVGALTALGLASEVGSASVALSGGSGLAVTAEVSCRGAATLNGSGTLIPVVSVGIARSAILTGAGTAAADGSPSTGSLAAVSGTGVLQVSTRAHLTRVTALGGGGSLSTTSTTISATAFTGTGSTVAQGRVHASTQAYVTASGEVATVIVPRPTATPTVHGTGALKVEGTPYLASPAEFAAEGQAAADTTTHHQAGVAYLTGDGIVTALGNSSFRDITVSAVLRTAWLADARIATLSADVRRGSVNASTRTAAPDAEIRRAWSARSRK